MSQKLLVRFSFAIILIICIMSFLIYKYRYRTVDIQLPPTNLHSSDLRFGEEQVDQMMLDRPEMFKCVNKKDVIYTWVMRRFAGEAIGQRIYWSSDLPDCGNCLASSAGPEDGNNGVIRIRWTYDSGVSANEMIPCELMWQCVVYETFNISTYKTLHSYNDAALEGSMSKQEWVYNCSKLEFNAMHKTKNFYKNIWKPWSKNKSIETHEGYWFSDLPATFNEWCQSPQQSKFYLDFYSKYYETEIRPRLKNQASF